MKEIISTIMCLSFVTGTYEICIEQKEWHTVHYTGGGIMCRRWHTVYAYDHIASEDYVRSILDEGQWADLVQDGIIDCHIELKF